MAGCQTKIFNMRSLYHGSTANRNAKKCFVLTEAVPAFKNIKFCHDIFCYVTITLRLLNFAFRIAC